MPQKRKRADEMTDEEILKRVFPKPVVEELKRQVAEPESPDTSQDKGE